MLPAQGYNALRKTPCLPLRKLANATTIVLDGNLFAALPSGALHNVRVKFLSISRNAHLARIDENAIRSMPDLQVRGSSFDSFAPPELANLRLSTLHSA